MPTSPIARPVARPIAPLALAIATSLAGCVTAPAGSGTPQAEAPMPADNPFFQPSPLQYGYPQFDKVEIARDGASARLVGREVTTIQSKGRTRRACADTEQTLVLVGGQIRSKGQTDTITRCR